MRIGVTGGTGFIGQYLIRDYGDKHDFIVPIRYKSRAIQEGTGAKFIESDYTVDGLKRALEGCDAVIHLAARGMPKNRDPLKMEDYLPNVIASANVFEACKEIGIDNVVSASSKSVWGVESIFGSSFKCFCRGETDTDLWQRSRRQGSDLRKGRDEGFRFGFG